MRRYFRIIKEFVAAIIPYTIFNLFSFLLPIKKNKFLCISMAGNNYGDSIKCLSDYISDINPEAEVVWAFSDLYYSKVDCSYIKVRLYSFRYYYHLVTSKFFLTNQQCRNITFRKRKGQIKLQTWHGTALKRLGEDVKDSDVPNILRIVTPNKNKYELRDTDIFIAGSKYMKSVFESAYHWDKVWLTGLPRNDIFFHHNEEIKWRVKKYFGISHQKIILYAPTFRPNGNLTYYDLNLERVKSFFEEKDKCDYSLIVRFHPNILSRIDDFMERQHAKLFDATLYPDVQELLYSADVLITDYSSVMFDFMYSYKPIVLYVNDRNEYNRGFYLDIDKLPFVIVNNNTELYEKLSLFEWETYHHRIDRFLNEIGSVEDGRATERIYNLLMDYSDKKNEFNRESKPLEVSTNN